MVLQKQGSNLFCVNEDIYIGHIPQEVSLPPEDTSSLPSITLEDIVANQKNETPSYQLGALDLPMVGNIDGVVTSILPFPLPKSSSNNCLSIGSRVNDLTSSLPSSNFQDNLHEKRKASGSQPEALDWSATSETRPKGSNNTPIIPDVAYQSSFKNSFSAGTRMQNGYIQSQRAIRTDPRFTSLTFKEKHLLTELQNLVVWKETPFWIGRKKIILKKGQYCTTERDFTNYLNSTLAKSDPKYTKTTTRRIIKKLFEMQISYQDVDQGRTIITIIDPTFYPFELEKSGPECGPKVDQEWTTKEEVQEYQEERERARVPSKSKADSETEKNIKVDLSPAELSSLNADFGESAVSAKILRMNAYCANRGYGYANWADQLRLWLTEDQGDWESKANVPAEKREFYEIVDHLKSLKYNCVEAFGRVKITSQIGYSVGEFKIGDTDSIRAMMKEKGLDST